MAFIEQVGSIRIEETDDTICVWWPDWVISVGEYQKCWLGINGKLDGCHPHLMASSTENETAREILDSVRIAGRWTIDDMVRIAGNRDAWVRHG